MTDDEALRRRDELLDQSSRTEADLQEIAKLDKIIRDAGVAAGTYDSRNRAASAQLAQSITRTIQSSADGAEGLTAYSDVVRAISNKIGAFVNNPLYVKEKTGRELESFAKAVGSVVIAIQKSGDAQFKAFRELSSSGLVMNMSDTFANLQGAGYTMAEMNKFTAIMKKNSTLFAALGGSAADGAKQFVDVATSIKESGLEEQYRNMGMSVDNINSSITQYMKLQLLSGSSKKQTTDEMREGVAALIDQQDRFAKLTGINAEEQNKANEQALGQEQYAANNAKLQATINAGGPEAEVAKKVMARNQELISIFGVNAKEQVGNLNKVLAGAVNDPGFQQFARAFPAATKAIEGGLTDSVEIMKIVQQDAAQTAKNRAHLAQQGLSDKEVGSFSAILNLSTYRADKMSNDKDNIAKTQAQQKAGLMDASTANMAKMNQAQRDVNQDVDKIVNDAVPTMISGTDKLAGMTAQLSRMFGGINISELLSGLGGGAGGSLGGGSAGVESPGGGAGGASVPADLQSYLKTTALMESGGNATAKAGTSSAGGMFQFLDTTWTETVKAMGKNYTLQDKYDPVKATEVMAYFTTKQQKQLELGTGKKASSTDLYMAHFLGAGGAVQFINAMSTNPNDIAARIFPAPAGANRSIFFDGARPRTLQEVYNLMGAKVSKAEQAVASNNWGGKALPDTVSSIGKNNSSKQEASTGPLQQGARGGILSGPIDGFMAMLHGTEAVIPMPDGKPIDVQGPGEEGSEEAESLMAMKMERMDTLLQGMTTYLRTTDRLLQLQS